MNFTLYTARCSGNAQNTFYPDKREIIDEESLREAISLDHVCAAYKNNRRSLDHFITGNVDVMDCDNDFSDDPTEWITPELYAEIFPEVSYVVVPSRHDGLPKGKKSARPRHHVYFPHREITDVGQCTRLKERIHSYAPFFDGGAMDAADCVPLTNETLNASMTLIEQITTLDKSSLMNLVCRIDSQSVKRRIEEAILYYIGVVQQWSGDNADAAADDITPEIPEDSDAAEEVTG